MNKKIVKDAMILTAFTLVLGLILGVVRNHKRSYCKSKL